MSMLRSNLIYCDRRRKWVMAVINSPQGAGFERLWTQRPTRRQVTQFVQFSNRSRS